MEHCKYTIFIIIEDKMEYVETFDTLKEAKDFQIEHQEIYGLSTIIIPTY